jgi:hypothetical protein
MLDLDSEILIQAEELLKIMGGGIISLPSNKWLIRDHKGNKTKLNNIKNNSELKDKIRKQIEQNAYFRYLNRDNGQFNNWIEAEKEVLL